MTRRTWAMLGAVALIAGLCLVPAVPASAASVADYVGMGPHATITGRTPGGSWRSFTAGEMQLRIDGGSVVSGYCIDIHTSISESTGRDLEEVAWAASGISNLDRVSYVLNTYTSGSSELPGTTGERAAAIQAAIWHLTDEFELRATGTPAAVFAGYEAILAAIPDEGLPVEPMPSLTVTPASATGEAGTVVGPFTVATTGSNLPLVVPDGVEVVDWVTGDPLTAVSDGTVFGIRLAVPGEVTVSMSTSATIHAGRAFARLDELGRPIVQRLILAETTEASTSAAVRATFTEVTTTTTTEPTTTTTEPTTTTTTTEPTTTTTEATTTTTEPEETTTTTTEPEETTTSLAPTSTEQVLGAVVERSLPRTGSPLRELTWAAMSLVAAGALVLATRRRLAVR